MSALAQQTALSVKYVGDLVDAFRVPRYQRGYRWTDVEVGHLLEDIWASNGEPYRLQPIVVQPLPDGRWDLVDGQQRLTTLFLVFQFMANRQLNNGAPYRLSYETRPDSAGYLSDPVAELAQRNIDYAHIRKAYTTIEAWFDAHGHRIQTVANRFYDYLFNSVEVIWYQVPEDEDEVELFTRLNVGRIALTDAELVKALLLAHPPGSVGPDRSEERAAQWDAIERDLRAPEMWSFVAGKRKEATRISLLLDVLADRIEPGGQAPDRPKFHTFETLRASIETDRETFWRQVVDLHSQLRGWFEDTDLFHRIGFLTHSGVPFDALVEDAKTSGRKDLLIALDAQIKELLDLTEAQLRSLGYDHHYDACTRVLLLMNILTLLPSAGGPRYSFEAHATGQWSLEHLDARQSKALTSDTAWRAWARVHSEVLTTLSGVDAARRDDLCARIDAVVDGVQLVGKSRFEGLQGEVYALYESAGPEFDDDIDSIANLALLGRNDNSKLNNAIFELKRQVVLELDEQGSYIPVCTRNAFLKRYTKDAHQQIHFWGPRDRDDYVDAMVDMVRDYLRVDVIA